jgi:hypothetical protein
VQCGYQLIVPFDTDDPAYARGAEIGMLLIRLQTEPRPVRAIAHVDNAEMLFRLAEATDTTARATELDADWLEVTFA